MRTAQAAREAGAPLLLVSAPTPHATEDAADLVRLLRRVEANVFLGANVSALALSAQRLRLHVPVLVDVGGADHTDHTRPAAQPARRGGPGGGGRGSGGNDFVNAGGVGGGSPEDADRHGIYARFSADGERALLIERVRADDGTVLESKRVEGRRPQ